MGEQAVLVGGCEAGARAKPGVKDLAAHGGERSR